jgi:alpha-L-fucosidase
MYFRNSLFSLLLVASIVLKENGSLGQYTPDWPSLDKRPVPAWYDEAKLGVFIHWGVFSVPSYQSEWFWWDWQGTKPVQNVVDFMKKNYLPGFTYADFAKDFKAEFFNPDQWTELLTASGAKYVVLTTKHHEGYCMWPSETSWNWNSATVGPNRDLVGDLANSIRKNSTLKFGVYHSLFEWFNPIYLKDKANNFTTQEFVKDKTLPELHDLVMKYNPEIIWSDGEWEALDTYWNSTQFLAWLYNKSPVKDSVVVNDRWGSGDLCKHGDFYTCSDNYNPGTLLKHKWENCLPLDHKSWGYRRDMKLSEVHTIESVITALAETVSTGGNLLVNIGPTKEGSIPLVFEERLRQLGSWLDVYGEAIYSTTPWTYQNDTTNPDVWYTQSKDNAVYAILVKMPTNPKINLGAPTMSSTSTVELVGCSEPLQWIAQTPGLIIDISSIDFNTLSTKWALAFKLTDAN